nr:hypothetical protein [Sphingomonas elodea]
MASLPSCVWFGTEDATRNVGQQRVGENDAAILTEEMKILRVPGEHSGSGDLTALDAGQLRCGKAAAPGELCQRPAKLPTLLPESGAKACLLPLLPGVWRSRMRARIFPSLRHHWPIDLERIHDAG